MALTATHFPENGLTFAILFGCPLSVEAEVIQRLSKANLVASHPLVLPGIFAELERTRHISIVENMIDRLESRIYELDLVPSSTFSPTARDRDQIHRDQREDFLDTAYLRNGLISWNNQLRKMVIHSKSFSGISSPHQEVASCCPRETKYQRLLPGHERRRTLESTSNSSESNYQIRKMNFKVQDRLEHIIEEYDDKIRDCTMRLDGMAMATQWVNLQKCSLNV